MASELKIKVNERPWNPQVHGRSFTLIFNSLAIWLSDYQVGNHSFFRCDHLRARSMLGSYGKRSCKFFEQLAETVERAAASIVAVHARRGIGSSGFVWRDNLILTSSEGVRAEEGIKVALPDGRVTAARLRGRDPGTDLAVLEIDANGLPTLDFADDAALKAGQIALAVGRTANTGPIASFGIISGVSGEWKTWRGGKLDPLCAWISRPIPRSPAAQL